MSAKLASRVARMDPDRATGNNLECKHRSRQAIRSTLGVRTLDSLHVACALEKKAKRFWTFDERHAKLAEAVGLSTHL